MNRHSIMKRILNPSCLPISPHRHLGCCPLMERIIRKKSKHAIANIENKIVCRLFHHKALTCALALFLSDFALAMLGLFQVTKNDNDELRDTSSGWFWAFKGMDLRRTDRNGDSNDGWRRIRRSA